MCRSYSQTIGPSLFRCGVPGDERGDVLLRRGGDLELDHHPGILLDNDEPEPFHVHTILRVPNGGDYGMALVRARAAG